MKQLKGSRWCLDANENFASKVHSVELTGFAGKKFKHCINWNRRIWSWSQNGCWCPKVIFPCHINTLNSNVDASHLINVTKSVNFEETIFVMCSKTYNQRDSTNGQSAKKILLDYYKSDDPEIIKRHFVQIHKFWWYKGHLALTIFQSFQILGTGRRQIFFCLVT